MNYYDLLGVNKNATQEEIKVAYRIRVFQYHPDVNKSESAPDIFMAIQKAYGELSDVDKRNKYDNFLARKALDDIFNKVKSESTGERTYQNQSKTNYRRNATVKPTFNHNREKEKSKKTKESLWVDKLLGFLIAVAFFGIISFIANKCDDSSKNNYASYNYKANETKEINEGLEIEGDPDHSINNESTQSKYYLDNKGNMRVVPTNRVNAFMEKYPNSRLATNEEILKIESKKLAKKAGANLQEKSQQIISDNYPEQSLTYTRPINGSSPYSSYYGVGIFDNNSRGKITIENGTYQDAIVFIYEQKTDKIIRNIYIRSKSKTTITRIPEGYYRMKTSYGNNWASDIDNGYGNPKGGFTKDVSFSEMASHERFDMNWEETYSGINYPTYTVTLHKVQNGNLHTKSINKNKFFN